MSDSGRSREASSVEGGSDGADILVVYNGNDVDDESRPNEANQYAKIRRRLKARAKTFEPTTEIQFIAVDHIRMLPDSKYDEETISKCDRRIRTPGHGPHLERFIGVLHESTVYLVIGCETFIAICRWIESSPPDIDKNDLRTNEIPVVVATFNSSLLSLDQKANYMRFTDDRDNLFNDCRRETQMMISCRSAMKALAGENFEQVWRLPRALLLELFGEIDTKGEVGSRFVNLIIASVLPDAVYRALYEFVDAIESQHQRLMFKSFKLFNRDVPRMIKTALIDGRLKTVDIVTTIRRMLSDNRISGKDVDQLKITLRSEKMNSSAARVYRRRIVTSSSHSQSSSGQNVEAGNEDESEARSNGGDESGDDGVIGTERIAESGNARPVTASPVKRKSRFGILAAMDEQSDNGDNGPSNPTAYYMAFLRSSSIESAQSMIADKFVKCAAWIQPPIESLSEILSGNPDAQMAIIAEESDGKAVTTLAILFKISLPSDILNKGQFPFFASLESFYACVHSVTDIPKRMYYTREEIPRQESD